MTAANDPHVSTRTEITLIVYNEEPIHPEIVRDDLAAILDSHGYDYSFEVARAC